MSMQDGCRLGPLEVINYNVYSCEWSWGAAIMITVRSLGDAEGANDDDPLYGFLVASQGAIRSFADRQYRSLAKLVRYDLRKYRPTGLFDDLGHRHLWDEYCLHVQYGPSQLDEAWEQTVQPHITHRLAGLHQRTAVLLTIAAQWSCGEHEYQDGHSRNDDLISREAWKALRQLANENPQDWNLG